MTINLDIHSSVLLIDTFATFYITNEHTGYTFHSMMCVPDMLAEGRGLIRRLYTVTLTLHQMLLITGILAMLRCWVSIR